MSTDTPRPASAADRDSASLGRQLLAAFDAVADVPPAQREAAIQALGLQCPELERELRALLDRDARTGPLDATLSGQIQPLLQEALPELDPAPAQIGPYAVLRLLGEGGMGRVYLARRSDGPVSRDVAIKLIRPDRAGAGLLARFEAERRHLAALDHPGICRFIDADSLADGTPYVVMEAVQGEPIIDYCQRHGLGLRARVELLRTLLAAVAHAHDRLLLHRDIKPHNVLVTADGQPKLLDFGIAKSIEDAQASVTRTAERFFTPNASAPEQLLGEPAGVACDVYSLGALAYELLSGALPFDFNGLRAAEIERLVLQVAPPLMSERSTLPWARELKGDLDAIVATCLRKAPGERYRNVDALDAELQRWLEGRPVTARAPSWAYRSRLFIRRHRVAVGLSAALVAAIAVFGSGLALQAIELREQRNLAVIERDRALQVVEILESAFRNADPGRTAGDKVTARQILDAAAPRIELIKGSQPQVFGRLSATLAKVELDFGNHERAAALIESALEAHQPNTPYSEELLLVGSLANSRYGNLKRADELLVQAESAPITNTALHSLARARYSSAMSDHATVLAITARALELDGSKGLADPSILISNEIRWLRAVSIMRSVSVEAALSYLGTIIDWQRTALSDSHPYLLRSRHYALRFRTINSPAIELLEPTKELLEEMLHILGPNSSESASARMLLADLLNKLGRREESLLHFRQALAVQTLSKGAEHVDTVRLKMILSGVLHNDRTKPAPDESIELLTEAYATCSRSYRPWSPITMTAERSLINAHLSRKEWTKAFEIGEIAANRSPNDAIDPSSLAIYRSSLQDLMAASPCSSMDPHWKSECESIAKAFSRTEVRPLTKGEPE